MTSSAHDDQTTGLPPPRREPAVAVSGPAPVTAPPPAPQQPVPFRPVPLPFRHVGSKAREMPRIVPLIPRHTNFVSVFGGSGAELLYKPRSPVETFNDKACDIAGFFNVLRDRSSLEELVRRVRYTPHSRREYGRCVALLGGGGGTPVDRAYALAVVGNQMRAGRAATIAEDRDWGYCRASAGRARWPEVPRVLEAVARRFASVQVENQGWEDILRRYDHPTAVLMLDPPYPLGVRKTAADQYEHELDDRDHARLLEAVQHVRGYVILWSYENELYESRLCGWYKYRFKTRCGISPASSKPIRIDVAWLNYDPAVEQPAFPTK